VFTGPKRASIRACGRERWDSPDTLRRDEEKDHEEHRDPLLDKVLLKERGGEAGQENLQA